MWLRSPLLAAALGALALAGCGSDNAALIPEADADQLSTLVGEAAEASAAGDCDDARRAVGEAELQLSGLPRKTSKRLKANLKQWLEHLDGRIAEECKPPKPEETPTPDPTETPTETPTAEPTEEPTETPTAHGHAGADGHRRPGHGGEGLPEEPPGTGGVPPEDG